MPGAVTKRDLVKSIAGKTGMKQGDVQTVVQAFLDGIIDNMADSNRIELRDFGVFEARKRKSRIARNPRTGDSVVVPDRTVPHFKPGRLMRQKVGGND